MMSSRCTFWTSLAAVAVLVATSAGPGAVAAASERPELLPPVFAGDALPEPPQQHTPWTPPVPSAALPEKLLAATRELFAQGLADPRGCEYREVEVITQGWGEATMVHAWVLPAGPGVAQRFAVGWNGLVYPVLKVGAPADLHAEVRAIIADGRAQMESAKAQAEKSGPGSFFWPFSWGFSTAGFEKDSLTLTFETWSSTEPTERRELLRLPCCLLLRLGENEFAAQWWQEGTAFLDANTSVRHHLLPDPYGQLASDWAQAMLFRAVGAHTRGDDRLALLTARDLARVRPTLETAAVAHGSGLEPHQEGTAPLFSLLTPLPPLLADQERRANEPKVARMIPPEEARAFAFSREITTDTPEIARLRIRVPDQAKRIASLIRELEETVAPAGPMGGVDMSSAAAVQALVTEGEAAVEPLLDCLENDPHLTRSANDLGHAFYTATDFVPVSEAARAALDQIFKTHELGARGYSNNSRTLAEVAEARRQMVAVYRGYWEKNKKLNQSDRWFAIMADDHATPEQWVEAATRIVGPADKLGNWGLDEPWTGYPMVGEALRNRASPSLTELLTSRMQELAKRIDGGRDYLREAGQLALALVKWDGAARKDELRQMSLVTGKAAKARTGSGPLISLYLARAAIGDPRAAEDYAAWIVTTKPADFETDSESELLPWLSPLSQLSGQPAIIRAAGQLFGRTNSPWADIFQGGPLHGQAFENSKLICSQLITLPAFRELLSKKLVDKTAIGTAILAEQGGSVAWHADNGAEGGDGSYYPLDPLAPPAGSSVRFRICDLVAHRVGDLPGCPKCELYWPETKRDEAVAACAAFLQNYGANLRAVGYYAYSERRLAFPSLDHPATAADVANGWAIFALNGERRVWPLPNFPMPQASWPKMTSGKEWYSAAPDPATGKTQHFRDTEGTVWQAEEVRENGQWVRYFGFVGGDQIVRVPAAEVEFPGEFPWGPLEGGLDSMVKRGELNLKSFPGDIRAAESNTALPIVISLRNRRGIPQDVPALTDQPDRPRRLATGVQLQLRFHALNGENPDAIVRRGPGDGGAWQEVPYLATAPALANSVGKRLEATEEWEAVRFDLRDFFNFTAPGLYELKVIFGAPFPAAGTSLPVRFIIARAADASPP